MPPVRREHEFWHGGCESFAQPALADDFTCYLRDFELELSALRGESSGDDPRKRISSAGRRIVWHLQFWGHQRSGPSKVWRLVTLAY